MCTYHSRRVTASVLAYFTGKRPLLVGSSGLMQVTVSPILRIITEVVVPVAELSVEHFSAWPVLVPLVDTAGIAKATLLGGCLDTPDSSPAPCITTALFCIKLCNSC